MRVTAITATQDVCGFLNPLFFPFFFFSFFAWLFVLLLLVLQPPCRELLSLVEFADVTLWERCRVVLCPAPSPPAQIWVFSGQHFCAVP